MKILNIIALHIIFITVTTAQNWEQVGFGTNRDVRVMYTDTLDNVLYIGGSFRYIGNPFFFQ